MGRRVRCREPRTEMWGHRLVQREFKLVKIRDLERRRRRREKWASRNAVAANAPDESFPSGRRIKESYQHSGRVLCPEACAVDSRAAARTHLVVAEA